MKKTTASFKIKRGQEFMIISGEAGFGQVYFSTADAAIAKAETLLSSETCENDWTTDAAGAPVQYGTIEVINTRTCEVIYTRTLETPASEFARVEREIAAENAAAAAAVKETSATGEVTSSVAGVSFFKVVFGGKTVGVFATEAAATAACANLESESNDGEWVMCDKTARYRQFQYADIIRMLFNTSSGEPAEAHLVGGYLEVLIDGEEEQIDLDEYFEDGEILCEETHWEMVAVETDASKRAGEHASAIKEVMEYLAASPGVEVINEGSDGGYYIIGGQEVRIKGHAPALKYIKGTGQLSIVIADDQCEYGAAGRVDLVDRVWKAWEALEKAKALVAEFTPAADYALKLRWVGICRTSAERWAKRSERFGTAKAARFAMEWASNLATAEKSIEKYA